MSLCFFQDENEIFQKAPSAYKDIYDENLVEKVVGMLMKIACTRLKVSKNTPLEVITAAGILATPKFLKFEKITEETDCQSLKEFPLDIEIGN